MLVELAAEVLDAAGLDRHRTISASDLTERYLPEWEFRKRNDRYKIRWTIQAAAGLAGGLAPDVLGEATWRTDDLHFYAFVVVAMFIRAAAEANGLSVTEVCEGLPLSGHPSP